MPSYELSKQPDNSGATPLLPSPPYADGEARPKLRGAVHLLGTILISAALLGMLGYEAEDAMARSGMQGEAKIICQQKSAAFEEWLKLKDDEYKAQRQPKVQDKVSKRGLWLDVKWVSSPERMNLADPIIGLAPLPPGHLPPPAPGKCRLAPRPPSQGQGPGPWGVGREGMGGRAEIYCAELRSFRRGCMALRSREDTV